MNTWTYVRLSRAAPPGLAPTDAERLRTYAAALQQSEELLAAARRLSAASRPLPLFYSLSQAGRAIAAAHAEEEWQLRGHGLSLRTNPDQPMASRIRPEASGSFPRLSDLYGCSLRRPARLDEVWGAIPDLADTPAPPIEFPRALYVEPVAEEYPFSVAPAVVQAIVVSPADESDVELDGLLAGYPGATGASPTMEAAATTHGYGRVVRWPLNAPTATDRWRRIEELTSADGAGARWLIPGIGESPDLLDPFLLWWLLLYGFSILARYEPAHWVRLLDVDASSWAVGIESALDVAVEVVPELVLRGIYARDDR